MSDCVRRGTSCTVCLQKDEEEELIKRAQEGMNAEECQFSVEFPVKQEALVWSDKYRPRKPRFFNRVHTVRYKHTALRVRLHHMQKRKNRASCHLGHGLGWAKEPCIGWGPGSPPGERAILWASPC